TFAAIPFSQLVRGCDEVFRTSRAIPKLRMAAAWFVLRELRRRFCRDRHDSPRCGGTLRRSFLSRRPARDKLPPNQLATFAGRSGERRARSDKSSRWIVGRF